MCSSCRGPLAAVTDSLGRVQILDTAAAAVVRILKGYRDARCAWVLLPAAASATPDQPASMSSLQTGNEVAVPEQTPQSGLPQASAAQEQPSAEAGSVEAETRGETVDLTSDTSSQDSFASARDASLAPMDMDQGHVDEQDSRVSWKIRAAQPGSTNEAAHSRAADTVSPRASQKPGRRSGGYQTAEHRLLLAVHAPRRGVIDVWQAVHGPRLCSIRAGSHCCILTVPPLLGVGNAAGGAAASVHAGSYLLDCVTGQLQSLTEAVGRALSTSTIKPSPI